MTGKPKAVVLLSGGMDSCVTTAIARQTFNLALAHASYGQRTERRERQAFDEIADFYGVRERLVVRLDHFAQIGGSALTDTRIAVPEPAEPVLGATRRTGVPSTYVPFRNTHLLALGVSWAEVIGARAVFLGAVAEDSSGYPDCRPEYFDAFRSLALHGTRPETQIAIETPVLELAKHQIVARGIELGAPLHLTWSCYQFDDAACGGCESCQLRLRAFAQAGITDSIPYRAQVER